MPSTLLPTVVETEVPTWKSPNELIHERINFDDTIWGFGLAGGAYYKTPLRITYVRPGSRAEMAHILPGDVVLKINGIDSSTLTLEEAHEMIVESGIHLKINVTSPDDLEDNYFCYQDPLEPSIEELKAKEVKLKGTQMYPKVLGKCSHWSLQWPWKCKRKIIYKESNCHLVPSKFEEKHKDTRKPEVKQDDMIVLDNTRNVMQKKSVRGEKEKTKIIKSEKGDISSDNIVSEDKQEGESINTQQDSTVPEVNVMNQNDSNNINDKDSTIKHPTSNKTDNDDATEVIDAVDRKNEEMISEQNNLLDSDSENLDAGHTTSANKNDDDLVEKQDNSSDRIEENSIAEQTSSVTEDDETITTELSSSENKNYEPDVVKTGSVENNNEQISIEADDAVNNNKSDKFENSDIPGIGESEKLNHNSR